MNKLLFYLKEQYFLCIHTALLFMLWGFMLADAMAVNDNGLLTEKVDNLKIPVFEGHEKLEHYSVNDGKIAGFSYRLVEPYPAKNVIDFYKKEMKNRGFISIVSTESSPNETPLSNWQRYTSKSKLGFSTITEFTLDWTDKEKTSRIKLILRYLTKQNSSSESGINYEDWLYLEVLIQKMPFFLMPTEVVQ